MLLEIMMKNETELKREKDKTAYNNMKDFEEI
jgi:hypothetical protein